MQFAIYNHLTEDAKYIRKEVFMKEQGFRNEFDSIDDNAKHIVLFDNNVAIATCRLFWNDKEQCYNIGRVAVMKKYRGNGLGEKLLIEAEKCIIQLGGKKIKLSGQVRVEKFYEKMGYQKTGNEYLDEGCPHIIFQKEIN